jgi:prepilin-type processing-associated H-X9-DG protein
LLENPAKALTIADQWNYRSAIPLSKLGRGANWVDGAAPFGLVNTILAPNGPSAALGSSEVSDGFYSAGSFHTGGVNVCMMDGSVQFISDSIDTGDLTKPVPDSESDEEASPSPYGVWGALGTAQAADKADRF